MNQRIIDASIIAGVTLLLLAACEIGARIQKKGQAGRWAGTQISEQYKIKRKTESMRRPHHFLITGPRENTTVRAVGKRADINSWGYRSPQRSVQKSDREFRILCAGGSTTFDLTVTNNDYTWPAQLEGLLNLRHTGREVSVWNAGFPGWSSVENIISLSIRDLDIQPDLIILFQGINDLRPLTYTPFDAQYEKGHGDLRVFSKGIKPLKFYHRSVFLENLNRIFFGKNQFWFQTNPTDYHKDQVLEHIPDKAVQTYLRNLQTINAIALGHKARLVVVPQVLHIRKSNLEFDYGYLAGWVPSMPPQKTASELMRLNDAVKEFCIEESITYLDPGIGVDWNDEDFADPMHFTDTGSRKLAEFLASALNLAEGQGDKLIE